MLAVGNVHLPADPYGPYEIRDGANRTVHPDPVATPGFTWTPGSPEGEKVEVFDRIDWVLFDGPAEAQASRVVGEADNPNVDIEVDTWPSDHRGVVSTFDAPRARCRSSSSSRRGAPRSQPT